MNRAPARICIASGYTVTFHLHAVFYTDEYPAFPITLGETVNLAVQNAPVFLAAQASLNVSCERSA